MADNTKDLPGGSYLVTATQAAATLTPEDLNEEQQMMTDTVADFMKEQVGPNVEAIEGKDLETLVRLVKEAGELGILGVDVPEELGGMGLDSVTATCVFDAIGAGGDGSFATTLGAHSGIGTWPILFFGSEEQRARYLPKIATGEWIAAYALTEANSGSDAMAAKCTAELTEDGAHYKVNGTKVFITNAHIADVFTVFCKIGGENACLIVERETEGVSIGEEEHKLGIRGSSTANLILEDALVPVENLLGEVGKGHHVVLNTLNLGRYKLGAGSLGAMRAVLRETAAYTSERKQFGQTLDSFGAIQAKLADMAIAKWVGEAVVYRTAGMLNEALEGVPPGAAASKAIKQCSIECSIVKVLLSEMLCGVVDHAVQAFGGYGYSEEYPVARAYRDARINPIFEGTNEINRMLLVGELTTRAFMKNEIDLMSILPTLGKVKSAYADASPRSLAEAAKQLTILMVGVAVQTHMMELKNKQQVLLALADMMIGTYAMESAVLRLEKLNEKCNYAVIAPAIVATYTHEMHAHIVNVLCPRIIASLYDNEKIRGSVTRKVANLACEQGVMDIPDVIAARETIAKAVTESGGR